MYDEGPHIVLRRDGVCIVAKTPDGDMPQIEYWGRDFAFDTAAAVYGGIIAVDENQWSHVIQQHECTKLTHVQTACAG